MLAGASLAGIQPPDLVAASDSGVSSTDNYTNQTTLTINVTIPGSVNLNPGDSIELRDGTTIVASQPAKAGVNAFVVTQLNGTSAYSAQLSDTAGSAGTASPSLSVEVDTVAPTFDSVTTPTPSPRTYVPGDTLTFGLNFSEPIFPIGTPVFPITIGSGATSLMAPDVVRDAAITAGGSKTATASYTIGSLAGANFFIPESTDANGVQISGSLTTTLGVNDIIDKAGNSVSLSGIPSLSPADAFAANTSMAAAILVNVAPTAVATFFDPSGNAVATPVGSLSPRVTPVPTLTIKFTNPATFLPQAVPFRVTPPGSPPSPPFGSGTLTIDDFRLTRNGVIIPDLASKGVVITTPTTGPNAYADFQLAGLENVTNEPGAYTLTFSDLGIGESRVVSWVKDYTTPAELRATMTPSPVITGGRTDGQVGSITVRFTDAAGAVDGVYQPYVPASGTTPASGDLPVPVEGIATGIPSPTQFQLYRDGSLVAGGPGLLAWANTVSVSGSGDTYVISGLSTLTKDDGFYELRLLAGSNGIKSLGDSDTTPNGSTLKTPVAYTWQKATAPTVVVTSNPTSLTNGQTATITFTLSKPTINFVATDIVATNGTISNFKPAIGDEPLEYTATFTPNTGSVVTGTVTVPAGAFTDALGNFNTAGSVSLALNTPAPTVTILSSKPLVNLTETAVITFTLSAASINFGSGNVDATGGTLSNFTGSGTTYTAIFTPNANQTLGVISVQAGKFTDADGNGNLAGSIAQAITIDSVAPTIAITSNVTTLGPGQTATITFTLSEPSTTFTADDVIVSGGSLGTGTTTTFKQISPTVYTATLTPAAGFSSAVISVPAGAFADAAGNANTAGGTTTVTIDAIAPTVIVTSDKASLANGNTATITFTLSKASSNFTATDIIATNGTISNFKPTVGNTLEYTATFTPSVNATGVGTVTVPAAVFTDTTGNASVASNTLAIAVDTVIPTLATITAPAGIYRVGQTIAFTVTFSEPVVVNGTPALNVYIGTAATETLRIANYVAGTGTNTLTFHYTVASSDTNDVDGIRLQQIVLPSGSSIKDQAGNDAGISIASPTVPGNVFVMTKPAKATFTILPNPLSSPRSTPVSVIKVAFDNPVPFVGNADFSGWLSLADFELTRNGVVVPFPTGARLTQSGGYNEFEISNLSGLTEAVGTYILTFSDAQIGDRATTTWIKTASTPGELTATIALSPTAAVPRRIPVDTATIAFSQPVVNVDLSDFVFKKNGVVVPSWISTAVLSGSGDSYVISGLTTLTNDPGSTYEITLLSSDDVATPAVEGDIATLAGGTLIAPVSTRWTFEPPVAIVGVTPVVVPPSGYFRVGDVMEFSVKFSERVFVTNPQFLTMPILLGTGTNVITVQAGYVRGDATDTLVYRYQPQPTDEDLDGILLTGTLSLGTGTNVGTIKDSAGIDAVLAYTQPNTTSLRVDSKSPQITAVSPPQNRTYGVGGSIIFSVTFNEAVTYTGTPRIPLVIGTKTVYADVIAGKETPTLIFLYVVQQGDNDSDGVVASNQIALNAGTVSDMAGNPAILTFPTIPDLSKVLVDTAAPAAPLIIGVVANNTGADVTIPNGGATADNTLKIVGTAEAGSIVTVFLNGSAYGTTIVPGSGTWEFTTFTLPSPLAAGNSYSFTAKATDALGNEGPLSAGYTVTVDTTAPSAPTVAPQTAINPRPTLTGTAKLLSGETLTVTIVIDAANNVFLTYPVTPKTGSDDWSLDLATVTPTFPSLPEGTYSVTATVTDAAGNATIDGTSSELRIVANAVTVNPLQTNKTRPTVTGTAVIPTGGKLEVTVNGQTYGVAPAADGTWSLDLATVSPAFGALGDGVYPVTATVFDAKGTTVIDPTTNELQIDTTGPAVLAVDSLTPDGFYRVGQVISIQVRFNDAVVVDVTGGLPRLSLNTGRTAIYDPASSTPGTGLLTFLYTVQAGDNTPDLDYTTPTALVLNGATLRDAANNNASLSLPLPGTAGSLGFNRSITIDTLAPSPAPSVNPLTTTNTLPTITGTAVLGTGERLQVTVNGTTYDVLPDINGHWSVDLALASPAAGSPALQPLTSGLRYNVVATVIDAAGNATNDPTTNELSINAVAPVIIGAQDDVAPGLATVVNGGRTNDPNPTLLGSAEANRLITVSAALGTGTAVVIGTTTSDASGNWSFTPTSSLLDGTYTFTVESSVAGAGTPVKSVTPFTITIDTVAATITGVSVPAGIYQAGQTVPFTVTFTEPVFVIGSPVLNVMIGTGTAAVARTATFVAGSGTQSLVFHYTLLPTDNNDVDGVQVTSLTLSASDTIRDAAANNAVLAIANGVVGGNVFLMPKVAKPTFTLFPSARVNPRATPVSVIRVVFDNPVPFVPVSTAGVFDGVDATGQLSLNDFELTRNGAVIALPAVARLIPGSGNMEFEISNLSVVTETVGTYILTFADLKIGPYTQFTWAKTETTPVPLSAGITLAPASGASPRTTPVDSATITFSENVDNVDLSDFEFRMNGKLVPWANTSAVLSSSGSGSVFTITGLTSLTSTRATYELRLLADNQATPAFESDISSYAGGQLIGPVSSTWTYAGATRIASVTAPTPPASGFFKKGDVMNITVVFSDPVFVPNATGVSLPLIIGSSTVDAVYVGGTGTTGLTFRYTVQSAEEDRDGILLAGTITAPAGAIKDATGANVELTYSPPDTSRVFVDAVNPTLNATVVGPTDGVYALGSTLTFTATFSEPMLVSGSPRIAITIGSATRYATFAAGGETRILVFEYQIQSGDNDPNGIVVANAISLNGGTITDLAGNTVGLTFSPLSTSGVIVDAVAPAAPVITSVMDDVDLITGLIPSGGLTNDATPVVSGTAEQGSVVTLRAGTTVLGIATANSSGSWSITPNALASGTYALTATSSDAYGNTSVASAVYTIIVDIAPPQTPVITAVNDNVNPVVANVPSGGSSNDDTPTVGGSADAGAVVTLKSGATDLGVATADSAGQWTLSLSSLLDGLYSLVASVTDLAGNTATSKAYPIVIDTVAPTIAITSSKAALKAGETAIISFTLSEPSTSFSATDVTTAGGTLSGFTGSGANYSATFTPTIDSTTAGTISVAAGAFTDAAGNNNTAGSLANAIVIDTVVPTITIASSKTALKAGETAAISFTLSEASTNFVVTDVTTTGGVLSGFTGSGTNYSATFTPTANSITAGTISVTTGTFTDAAGNNNTAGALATAIAIDTVIPTIAITSSKAALKAGETATISFTLSEASTNFADTDVTATGGTLTGFTGSGTNYSAIFTPTTNSTTAGTISVAAGAFTDTAGNNNTAGSLANAIVIDTIAPTIAITSSKASLKAGETATISFTLSESSTNFAVADVTASGGTLSGFSGSGTSYSAIFTPTANSTTAGTISVAAGSFTDAAGNSNTAGSLPSSIAIDTVAPAITIASNKAALKAGETATISFTLSEPSTNFAVTDVNATGGTLSGFSGSGTSYSVTFTPTPDSTTAGTISVAAGTFTDAAGNSNTAGALANPIAIDTVVPTIAITSSKAALKAGETATISLTLSESSTNFAITDVTATGGTLSAFSGSGASYSATFTPTPNSTTAGTVSVAAGAFTDTAGNNNTAGSLASSIAIDTVAPTITITSNKSSLKSGETATISFTLSEASTNFLVSDVTTTGGTLSGFNGSGTNYAATFTPSVNTTAPGTVSVTAGAFTDAAGNSNTAGSLAPSIAIDTVAPRITITSDKAALKAGETATISFALSEASANFVDTDVTATGGTLSAFSGSGTNYSATFTPNANSTAAGTVSVTAGAFTDAAGNSNTAGSLASSIVIDTVAPTIAITSNKAALKAGETATVAFTLSEASNNFAASDVTVTGGTLSAFTGSGTTYSATFTPTTNSTMAGAVSVAAGTFTDAAGNSNTAGSLASTIAIDTVAPTITIASDKPALKEGETATISFTLSEASTNFAVTDVTTTGGTLSAFSGSGANYSATFTPAPNSTTAGTMSVAAGAFTDAAGNSNTAGFLASSIDIDTIAPTITITSDKAALKAGETTIISFTLSEASANFLDTDVTTAGGTLSGFTGSGANYSAIFTPAPNSTTAGTVSVAAGAFTDAAGNSSTPGSLASSIMIDTVSPTIAITSNKATLKAGDTATISFILSESTTSFSVADVTVTGGTLSGFTGSGANYSATFTPAANSTTSATISVAAGSFTDAAGNANTAGVLAGPIAIDTVLPSVSITTDRPELRSARTANITFTLSKPSTSFGLNDVVVTGGTLSSFIGSGSSYSAIFTPSVNSQTTGVVSVPSGTFTDLSGNPNIAGSVLLKIDTVQPILSITSSKAALRSGETAIISFTLSKPSKDFAFGDVSATGGTLSSFTGSGASYSAVFTPLPGSTTPGTVSVAARSFYDAVSNPNVASALAPVITIDTIAPTVAITSNKTRVGVGETAVVTFTLSEPSTTFNAGSVRVTGGTLSGFTGSGQSYAAIFTPSPNSRTAAVIRVPANGFTDAAGNANVVGRLTTGITVDTVLVVATASANAATLGATQASAPALPSRVRAINLMFNAPVTGFDQNGVKLYYTGPAGSRTAVALTGATIAGSGTTYTLTLPATAAALRGLYQLDVGGPSTSVRSGGVAMPAVSSFYWRRP